MVDLSQALMIRTVEGPALAACLPAWGEFYQGLGRPGLGGHPAWLEVLRRGLGQRPYGIEARRGTALVGLLPLVYLQSLLFGRFLVGLPYVNSGGVLTDDPAAAGPLIEAAAELANRLRVRYLELRHEMPVEHPRLGHTLAGKFHLRLPLPGDEAALWQGLGAAVRNQVRKGEKQGLTVHWGGVDMLADFYRVFAHNMRDLGTPVYSRRLFLAVLEVFADQAELCVVRREGRPLAAGLLVHGAGTTEVPSASSLRAFNSTCANMLMYWRLLARAVERGQRTFDFGRSSAGSGVYRFKCQWGAVPQPAIWQYYLREGTIDDMRPENRRYGPLIRAWQRLPVWLTRLAGPPIVRGIP